MKNNNTNYNNNNSNSEDFDDLVILSDGISGIPIYILIYIFLFGSACVVGTIGNTLVILTMVFTTVLRQSQNAFIASLATADLMVSSVTMPASIIGVLYGRQWYNQRSALCAFTATICAPGCVASMHSIAWIAISRYYYIGKYDKYLKYFTKSRIAFYITCIWAMSFVVHFPNHVGWGKTRYSFMLRYCTLDTDLLSYAHFYSAVLVIAIVLAFVFYTKIYFVLRSSTLARRLMINGNSDKRKSRGRRGATTFVDARKQQDQRWSMTLTNEIKIIKTSFKIFILFLITWSPLCVLFLIHVGDTVPPWVYLYAALAAHCNSTLNFVVYFVENDTFRTALINLLKKLFLRKRQQQVFNQTSSSSNKRSFLLVSLTNEPNIDDITL